MQRGRFAQGGRCAAAAFVGATLLMSWGCGHSSDSSKGNWTPDQVKAFRGAPPPPEERKEMANLMHRQRTIKLAPGFSTVAPAPSAAGPK